jgi:hypothetical protein
VTLKFTGRRSIAVDYFRLALLSLDFIPLAAAAYAETPGALSKAKAACLDWEDAGKVRQPHKSVRFHRTPMNCSGKRFELRGIDNQRSLGQTTAVGGAISENRLDRLFRPIRGKPRRSLNIVKPANPVQG